jgi:tRNA nucleotidyltransferase/poly(A) polymerase
MEFYMVGGAVRDELLGVKSEDIDFSVVLSEFDWFAGAPLDPFDLMEIKLKDMGFDIFELRPKFLTIRAKFPKGDVSALPAGMVIHSLNNLTADFVLARKESDYTDGRRPDRVEPGTLEDDLARRDFTMNAIAKDDKGNLIDPFNGQRDIEMKIIRAVGDPMDRIREDKLRLLRALRFSITKGFSIDKDLMYAIGFFGPDIVDVSAERVRKELAKMFNHNMVRSFAVLDHFNLLVYINALGINFQPTMKARVK